MSIIKRDGARQIFARRCYFYSETMNFEYRMYTIFLCQRIFLKKVMKNDDNKTLYYNSLFDGVGVE